MSAAVHIATQVIANSFDPYGSGDVVGGVYRLRGAAGPRGGRLKQAVVFDTYGDGYPVRLFLFDRPPVQANDNLPPDDNEAFNPSAASCARCVFSVPVASNDYVAVGTRKAAFVAIDRVAADDWDAEADQGSQGPGDLWLVVTSGSAQTWNSNNSLVVRLGFEWVG